MKEMAMNPQYTLYFSRKVSSFEDAANACRKAVGTLSRLGNSLVGKNPKYFEKTQKTQIVDSKPGTIVAASLTEKEVKEYKDRLLNIYWSIWGILNRKESEALAPFMNNFMDGVDVKEEDLDKFRAILLRAHQRVRKFKTVDELKGFVMYLRNIVYIAGESHCPTINSDGEALLFFEPASELAWIAIEEAEDGGYLVEGESDFVNCPTGVLSELSSSGYGFEPVTIRKAGTHFRRQG